MNDMTARTHKLTYEEIAGVAHEVNRAICQAAGDFSQQPWEQTPPEIRESSVRVVLEQLVNPRTPKEAFELWKAERMRDGWTWGPVKDPERKTNPALVGDYSTLPFEQRVKDDVQCAIIAACSRLFTGE